MPGPAVLPDERWQISLCWQTELRPRRPAHNTQSTQSTRSYAVILTGTAHSECVEQPGFSRFILTRSSYKL